MTNHELSDALLKLDATRVTGTADQRELTWRVLDRDRRRMRLWVIGTVAVWSIAAIVIFAAFIAFGFLLPKIALVIHEAGPAEGLEQTILLTAFLGKVSFFVAVAVLALVVSCLATIFLVLSARRATLRQVNASLLEISEQLKQLLAPPLPPAAKG